MSAPDLVVGPGLDLGAHLVVTQTLAETAPPSPAPGEEVPGYSSPGVVGFLVTFGLVVACIPLFVSMARKVRGVRYGGPADDPEGPAGARGEASPDGPEPPR